MRFNIAAAARLLTSRHQMIPSEAKDRCPEKERKKDSSGKRCDEAQKQGGGTEARTTH